MKGVTVFPINVNVEGRDVASLWRRLLCRLRHKPGEVEEVRVVYARAKQIDQVWYFKWIWWPMAGNPGAGARYMTVCQRCGTPQPADPLPAA